MEQKLIAKCNNAAIHSRAAFAIAFISLSSLTLVALSEEAPNIQPDPAMQSKIVDLAKAVREAGREGGREQALRAIVALSAAAGQDRTELVRQLI